MELLTVIFPFLLEANDAYYRMAIGNAPWPMGVTMVGIHERSAREKIFSNQVARIHHSNNSQIQIFYLFHLFFTSFLLFIQFSSLLIIAFFQMQNGI
jgi:hypothetical protein